ncbi:VWA domain-containing protein [Magnetospirillum sulfuroxidans]|uniref:VWA domain-containing protein n=1 Tax=Magnetospirillum sulfuroxidans TaxID=611300 RepID=A0ABS5I9P4_9PROT|nr:VWA domain-containing protein [Magnetospirillum sulfuroxidans]MBR9971147.1 VWA domain-containing protein [Magnetospirillum sulfuroxidans]
MVDRLQALRDLAARQAADPAAALLAAAAVSPPADAIYVVNGQPVIIGWGRAGNGVPTPLPATAALATTPLAAPSLSAPSLSAATAAAPTATVAAAAAAPVAAAASRFPWRLLGGLAALALLAAVLWWLWLVLMGTPPDMAKDDRLAALTAEEAALNGQIADAEAELRRRLAACAPEKPVAPPSETPIEPEKPPLPPVVEPEQPAPAPEPTPVEKPPVEKKHNPTKKPAAEPQPQPNPQPKPPKQQAMADPPQSSICPPPRKKWEAPELVLLLDASGSMGLKSGGGNDRLSAAKAAINRMLATLPGDMDVGMVVFGHCQGADNHKFFSPAERPRLKSLLESIRPMEGTPLARGIERAGNTVDGVSVPATLVVVTDGEDSCGGDPCAAARALKAAKPKLTINVVDVGGQGKSRCIAEATGGRMLPMRSAAELPELIRKASGETPVPPGCGGE